MSSAESVMSFVGRGITSEVITSGIISLRNPPPDPISSFFPGGKLSNGSLGQFANAIFVKGDDVYITGNESRMGAGDIYATTYGKYWKNGVLVNNGVFPSTALTYATAIFVTD